MEDLILQTKLQPPQIKGKILHRTRLLNLLKENLDKKLILICADAGYGKTTLLAQCCAEIDKPFIFYNLDTSDNDIAAFFNYLVSGIGRHYPGFGQRTRSIIPQTRNIEILVGTFINEFVEYGTKVPTPEYQWSDKGEKDFYIILDDYHCLQQNQQIGNALDYLLRHLPANLHLIISSRSTPPLDLAHYYAKQELFKIEREQLEFNLKEIQALLKEIYGLQVPDAEIDRIEQHSEGWITAIQLILQKISALGEEKAKETLNGYVASGEEIFQYFAREIFDSQPKKIQDFLMKSSILEYMNPEICDFLLNIKKSKQMLSFLEAEHIFISKVQDNYKYHPLFNEFLSEILKSFYNKAKMDLLNRKLGSYFVKIKDYFSAVNYFLISEDYEKAAKTLERACRVLPLSEKISTFLSLLNRLPSVILYKHPYLCLVKSNFLSFLGSWDEALYILFKIKKILQRKKNYKEIAGILCQIGFVHLFLMQAKKALFYENQALKLLGKHDSVLKAKVLAAIGNINRSFGQYCRAENFLKHSLAIARKIKNEDIEILSLEGLARVYNEEANFDAGIEIYKRLLVKYENKKSRLSYADFCSNAAALYIEVNNLTEGERLLNAAEKYARIFNNRRAIVYTAGIRGKLYLYQNKYSSAIEQYKSTLELNSKLNEKLVEIYARTDIAYAYLMTGEIIHAKNELKKVAGLLSHTNPPPILIDYLLIRGRLGLLEKKRKETGNKLHQALEIAKKHRMPYQEMIILYYLSSFYLANSDETQTAHCLKRCFNIAEQNNYNFFLIREGRNNIKVFEYALAKNIETNYVLEILSDIGTPAAKDLFGKSTESKITYDLDVRLFGRLEIKDKQGKVIEPVWRTIRTKSLFAYLVLNKSTQAQSGRLVENLWPRRGRTDGMHSLHEHVSYLRRILGTVLRDRMQTKATIIFKNKSYFLNPDLNFNVDALEFERLVDEARNIKSTEKTKSIQLYQKALDLYKGDFCPELDDAWSDEKRMFYRSIGCKIAQEIAAIYHETRDYHNSLQYYHRALEFDPCDENIHLAIMRLLSALGDRTGVLKQYKRLEQILSQELKAKPSAEAQRMYEKYKN